MLIVEGRCRREVGFPFAICEFSGFLRMNANGRAAQISQ